MTSSVLIVGSGHAGFQCAASLRQQGYRGRVILLGDEGQLPYQRPPLSKAYLLRKAGAADLLFRPEQFFRDQSIEFLAGHAAGIDRARRCVLLEGGDSLPYDHLVLATGSRARRLTIPGADLEGVLPLQTMADADRLMAQLPDCRQVVVAGAGFIGLEFAAAACSLGLQVRVVDVARRPMSRVLSADTAAAFDAAHRARGVDFLWGTGVERLEGHGARVAAAHTTDGRRLPADLVLVGIGATPRTELAAQAGLEIDNGICVDANLLTVDPHISAIGDAASFPCGDAKQRIRLESVQNATDQARAVAARLAGKPGGYAAVPWFWSDQGDLKLQIAGLGEGSEEHVVLGDPAAHSFSVLCIAQGVLKAVESVNRPGDHMLARRLLAKGVRVSAQAARTSGFELKALAS